MNVLLSIVKNFLLLRSGKLTEIIPIHFQHVTERRRKYLIEVYKKGLGNNTNIFPIVVQEFPLIEISLENQQRIVDEICCEIEKQNTLRDSIIEKRNYLDETIENAIS